MQARMVSVVVASELIVSHGDIATFWVDKSRSLLEGQ